MSFVDGAFLFVTRGTLVHVLFGITFLTFARGMFLRQDVTLAYGRRLFFWYVVVVALALFATSAMTWIGWHQASCGTACQYIFPPHSNYYFNEGIVRWASTIAFNAAIGLIGGLVFLLFARLTEGRIIDQLDVDLLTVGGMVAGWPNVLIFYGLVFVLTILLTVIRAFRERSAGIRMIITPVLPFAAAIVAVFGNALARLFGLYEIGLTLV